ncbi:MAG: hydroxymethylglutaryl-CoA synthase [Candidatus Lokiarchaeota archaeon]|nr:hydroxymethylglutaryl-CoA synthase [Candidatus Lokiarchaeota archaeon]
MVEIIGYGIYIPYNRIMLSEIRNAWNLSPRVVGEKSVPSRDENALTMGFSAAQNAIKNANIKPDEIEMLVFVTTSSPYLDSSLASQLSVSLFKEDQEYSNIDAIDLQGSTRATTMGIQIICDAIEAGRIKKGLIVSADVLTAAPGHDLELTNSAGAAALILGKDGGFAKIEDFYGFVTGFTDVWTTHDDYPRQSIPRFIRDYGFVDHCVNSINGLLKKRNENIDSYSQFVIQPINARFFSTVGKKLKISKEKMENLNKSFIAFGNTGCAGLLIGFVSSLEKATAEEKIMLTSYGSGMSDSVSIKIKNKINNNNSLDKFLKEKRYVNYFTYLRYNNIIKPFIE